MRGLIPLAPTFFPLQPFELRLREFLENYTIVPLYFLEASCCLVKDRSPSLRRNGLRLVSLRADVPGLQLSGPAPNAIIHRRRWKNWSYGKASYFQPPARIPDLKNLVYIRVDPAFDRSGRDLLTLENQDPIDTTFLQGASYDDFQFSPSLIPGGETVSTPSLIPVGSVDSGLGDGMDYMQQGDNGMGGQYDRRSSSEEKETLTPAQSRRKAQNRAA